jgi:hypothetical protein
MISLDSGFFLASSSSNLSLAARSASPKDLQTILITAMKLSAYDMYAHSNDASAKNWATMKKDYPNIKVKTFPKPENYSGKPYQRYLSKRGFFVNNRV